MKRVALISGVNRYGDSSIRDLRYAVEDTRKVANLLEQAGFQTRHLYDAPQSHHQEELERVSQGLEPGDLLLFYFCGHGVEVNGRHLMLCQDAKYATLQYGRGGLWLQELKEVSADSGADRVFVLDTCREALLIRRGVLNEMPNTASLRDVAAVPKVEETYAGSLTILCACDEGDTAQEDETLGMGLFSFAFNHRISEAVSRSESLCLDGDFVQGIRRQMENTARQHGLSLRQRPWVLSTGAFPLIVQGRKPSEAVPRQVPRNRVVDPTAQQRSLYREALNAAGLDGEISREEWQNLLVLRDELNLGQGVYQEIERALWGGTTLDEICGEYATSTKPQPACPPLVLTPPARQTRRPEVGDTITSSTGMKLAWIPPGEFMMGSPKDEENREGDEQQHPVKLSQGFFMGVYEVTQAQYEAVVGENPSHFKGRDRPVETVSWENAEAFCRKLSQLEGKTYQLPTEAQWEYACRAGTTTPFSFGETISSDQANYDGNSTYGQGRKGEHRRQTTPVGQFPANALGLDDMHGNVWEWCRDWLDEKYYAKSHKKDPKGPESGAYRVLRGGSWYSNPRYCRAACRYWRAPDFTHDFIGFRVLCVSED